MHSASFCVDMAQSYRHSSSVFDVMAFVRSPRDKAAQMRHSISVNHVDDAAAATARGIAGRYCIDTGARYSIAIILTPFIFITISMRRTYVHNRKRDFHIIRIK
jgi:hypothetical protein